MYCQTRSLLTKNDHEFIARTIGRTEKEYSSLIQLIDDPETETDLLHDKRLFERSMTVPPLFLSISPQLFFYVFVYQALDRKKIADDDLVDYIAGICVEFRSSKPLWQLSSKDDRTIYLVDLLNLMGDLDQQQQYHLRRHIGNVTLFLTGFFPDFIFKRNKNIGAPPIAYYEKIGTAQFETAANQSSKFDENAGPVLSTLAERFVEIRMAINLFADAYLALNNKKHSIEMIERQSATLDEESFRQSLEM
jgi:hypothetical protein